MVSTTNKTKLIEWSIDLEDRSDGDKNSCYGNLCINLRRKRKE